MGRRSVCSTCFAIAILMATVTAAHAASPSPASVKQFVAERNGADAGAVIRRTLTSIEKIERARDASAIPQGGQPTIAPNGNATTVAFPAKPSMPQNVAAQACSFPNCDRPLRGGTGIGFDTQSFCSAGFMAVAPGGENYLVTAGHCAPTGVRARFFAKSPSRFNSSTQSRSWSIGVNAPAMTVFGPLDYMAVRIDRRSIWMPRVSGSYFSEWSVDGRATRFSGVREPIVGEPVCKASIMTGVTCGTVIAVDVSIKVGGASLRDTFATNACSEEGDSGGPYVGADGALLGILSGGTGECPAGPGTGLSIAQSAPAILEHSGLRVPTG